LLQIIQSAPVSGAAANFSFATDCAISADDLFAYVLYAGVDIQGLAVMLVPTGTWLDFDAATPGQQDFALPLTAPNQLGLSPYGHSVVVSGLGQGSAGWAGRIDVDPFNPPNTTFTQYLGLGTLPSCDGASVSPTGDRAVVTALVPPRLLVFEVPIRMLLHNVSLPGGNGLNVTAWQDLRPDAAYTSFGSGCPGSLGVPTLQAPAGPQLGQVFSVTAGNLPANAAFLATGFSDSVSGPFLLPLDLGPFGVTGCSLLVDPSFNAFLLGSAGSATWNVYVPIAPGLLGLVFFQQSFAIDPPANLAGLTVSAGRRALVGL
jgi:hypothetical protein